MFWAKKFSYLVLSIFYADILCASDVAHSINWWHLGSAYKDAPALGWLSITFLIFVYIIVRVVKKPLSLYLETRSQDIHRQIEEGRLAKAESEKKLKLYEEKLKGLSAEIDKMKNAFSEQAHAEKRERERLAKEMEARIVRDAEDSIRASIERSKNRLAEEVINRALSLAEESIATSKRNQVNDFLTKNFVEDLRNTAAEKKLDSVGDFLAGHYIEDFGIASKEVH